MKYQENKGLEEQAVKLDRERIAMELIHASLGSGPWSMEFDENGEMISCEWTDTFRQMLGYKSQADFPNVLESWSDLLHQEDKPRVMREYWDTVRDHTGVKTYDVEYRLLTQDKGWRWFHAAGRLARARVPILAVTANAFKEDFDKAEAAGMNGHIATPLNKELMFKSIMEVLKLLAIN